MATKTAKKTPAKKTPAKRTQETPLLDLDAHKAERAKKQGDGPRLKFLGQIYVLPVELPMDYMFVLGSIEKGDVEAADSMVRELFGEEGYNKVRGKLTIEDFGILLRRVPALYGVDLGEFAGSDAPSN